MGAFSERSRLVPTITFTRNYIFYIIIIEYGEVDVIDK